MIVTILSNIGTRITPMNKLSHHFFTSEWFL